MSAPKFVHDDIVKLTLTGQTGRVKQFHQRGAGYVYGVQLGEVEPGTDVGEMIDVAEDELELMKIANQDETGLHIRYIS